MMCGAFFEIDISMLRSDSSHQKIRGSFWPKQVSIQKLISAGDYIEASHKTWLNMSWLDDFKRQQAGIVFLLITDCIDSKGVQQFTTKCIYTDESLVCRDMFDLFDSILDNKLTSKPGISLVTAFCHILGYVALNYSSFAFLQKGHTATKFPLRSKEALLRDHYKFRDLLLYQLWVDYELSHEEEY